MQSVASSSVRPAATAAPAGTSSGPGGSANSTMEQVKKLVNGLQASSAEISTVAEVINQVAKHTNLLALNANI